MRHVSWRRLGTKKCLENIIIEDFEYRRDEIRAPASRVRVKDNNIPAEKETRFVSQ
jgi:hypothetical protein